MRKTAFIVAVCGLMVMCGCIPLSLVPFYTEKDLVSRPGLVGTWNQGDPDEKFTIAQADSNRYMLTCIDKYGENRFVCRLFEMGGTLFMDLYPIDFDGAMNGLLQMHLIPGHSLLRVDQVEPTLKTASLSLSWLDKLLKANPKALAHVTTGDQVVITASTEEVQAFVRKHLNDEGAFDEPSEMTRVEK